MSLRTFFRRRVEAAFGPYDGEAGPERLDRGVDDWSDEPIEYDLTAAGRDVTDTPSRSAVTEAELLAIAVGVGIIPAASAPTSDAYEVTNLVHTPDQGIWFDPATGALVRIPRCALRAAVTEGLN